MKKSAGVQIMRVYFLFFHQIKCNKIDFAVKKTWFQTSKLGPWKFRAAIKSFTSTNNSLNYIM